MRTPLFPARRPAIAPARRPAIAPALFAAISLGAALLASPAAAEDIAAAEALFDRGLADMKAGKYETGCPAIAESQRLDPRPGTLFTLATCEAEWGHVATAVTRYGDYLRVYEALPDDKKANQGERPKVAAETRARLLPDVPQLTLSLPKGAPAGTVVQRNGEPVAAAALGIALPVDPGEYVLTTKTPSGVVREQRVSLAKGEKKQVTLEMGPAAAPGPTAAPGVPVTPAPDGGPSGRRVATYVIGGAGVIGLVAGGVLGGLAAAQKGTIDEHCGVGIGSIDELACDETGLDAANGAKGLGLGSTVALVAGGVAVGAAVVLFFTEPRPEKARSGKSGVRPSAGRGPWVSAGVLSAAPTGARLGVEGAW
jgi:hypothetical protein